MPDYRVTATAKLNGFKKTIIYKGFESKAELQKHIDTNLNTLTVYDIQELQPETQKQASAPKLPSAAQRRRPHYQRFHTIRKELQARAESDDLTQEEKLLLCRAACKLSRLLTLFKHRTIEIETGGKLKC